MSGSAVSILTRAVEMDKKKKYTRALDLYLEGIDILIKSVTATKDENEKKHLRAKAEEYMNRAEEIKKIVTHRQVNIEAGSTGYGYGSVFGEYLTNSVTYIKIEDPYISKYHQCLNLVRFCELAVQKCESLSRVSLITTQDSNERQTQVSRLEELKQSLNNRSILLEVTFSETLHDRQISFSNGWVIKSGRGLDYFRTPESKFVLGACDLELRQCKQTTINIFHCSQLHID